MPITDNVVYNAYGKKKRNPLTPYIDAGNGSTSQSMELANTQPTGTNTRLYNAYNRPETQSQPMTKVARAYSMSAAPSTQSEVSSLYTQATTPQAPTSQTTYQPGATLKAASANNTQPQSALEATPAATAQAGAQAQSALTGTPSSGNTTQKQPTAYELYGSQNNGSYSAQRQNALNQAEASYNKLLRYLPEYNEIMGMRGLGVSEQALLNAQSDYMQNVANINAQYDELEKAYGEQYRNSINTLSGELSAYLEEVGGDFNSEKYNERKQAYIDSGMYTAEEIAAAEALLRDEEKDLISGNNDNSIYTGDVTFNNNGGWWIFGSTDFSAGDNFSVRDEQGNIYRIESGGIVNDESLRKKTRNVRNGQVFGYKDKIYYKQDGNIYLIQRRAKSYADHYTNLYNKIFKVDQ